MKYFVFDADGVVIQSKLLTDNLEIDFGIPKTKVLPFFKGEFADCLIGEKDIKLLLPKYMEEWGVKMNLEELMEYWFDTENMPNHELIDFIQQLRSNGHFCAVATNQEKYRTEYMRKTMKFSQLFDSFYSSSDLGVKKPSRTFYQQVTKLLHAKPQQITFFDDREKNVIAAQEYGWNAHLFQSTKRVIELIKNLDK